ncbi:c-type cytochrome [Phenylobacterium sp. LjRoot225]|uniref:c-type cytochrome n=1 Tax=Phenylobacterium sp. LjRoot225 TaxID=3342285 RepID=UPI003ECCB98C
MKLDWLVAVAVGVAFNGVTLGGAQAAASPAEGATVFRQRCQSCHAVDPSRPSTLGPNLAGVVGRKAGSGAFQYTPALQASGLTWSKASLDQFLTGPSRMVPGTRMVVSLPDSAQRAAVIDYLGTLH